MRKILFAWCFDHGAMHHFPIDTQPWCTAAWVAFTAGSEEQAIEAKRAAYGDTRFLHELPAAKQLEIIEIGEART